MEEKLCFIKFIGVDSDGLNLYEFLFTKDIDTFWGENFEYMPCCLVNNLIPNEDDYSLVKKVKCDIKLKLIQESCCNSFQDCIDHCVALAYEDLTNYEEYPQDGRLVLQYGMEYEDVEELLALKNIVLE